MEPEWASLLARPPYTSLAGVLEDIGLTSLEAFLAVDDETSENHFENLIRITDDAVRRGRAPAATRRTVRENADALACLWALAKVHEQRVSRVGARAFQRGVAWTTPQPCPPAGMPPRAQHHTAVELEVPSRVKRFRKGPPEVGGAPSLRAQESAHKALWVERLLRIRARAGDAAHVGIINENSPADEALVASILGRGAWRTISTNVRAWERFERFARGIGFSPFPPSTALVIQYCQDLEHHECGPTVIPSFRAALAWVCKRLAMESPELATEGLLAIQSVVVEQRGAEIREATALDLDVVRALELAMTHWRDGGSLAKVVLGWWLLCMVWDRCASMTPCTSALRRWSWRRALCAPQPGRPRGRGREGEPDTRSWVFRCLARSGSHQG